MLRPFPDFIIFKGVLSAKPGIVFARRCDTDKRAEQAGVASNAALDLFLATTGQFVDIFGIAKKLPPQRLDVVFAFSDIGFNLVRVVLRCDDYRDRQRFFKGFPHGPEYVLICPCP